VPWQVAFSLNVRLISLFSPSGCWDLASRFSFECHMSRFIDRTDRQLPACVCAQQFDKYKPAHGDCNDLLIEEALLGPFSNFHCGCYPCCISNLVVGVVLLVAPSCARLAQLTLRTLSVPNFCKVGTLVPFFVPSWRAYVFNTDVVRSSFRRHVGALFCARLEDLCNNTDVVRSAFRQDPGCMGLRVKAELSTR